MPALDDVMPTTHGDRQTQTQALLDQLLRDFVSRLPNGDSASLQDLTAALNSDPARVAEIQERYYRAHLALWSSLATPGGGPSPREADTHSSDHRFDSAEWRDLPWFRYLKQAYLLNSHWLEELLEAAPLDAKRKQRARFVLRQCIDALAPTNSPATNPDVIRLAVRTQGASLAEGLSHLRQDLARGHIQMSDYRAFEVGRNIAITRGAVVHQSPVAQLIQYAPSTEQVRERPLLIVPPFINKYYILDLQPENSLVRYALQQGIQVFMVSWRNIPRELGASTWEDYVREGVYRCLDAAQEITGAGQVNALGFCVGGTLLASALAVMEHPERVASLTLLATMLDFSNVGDIGVYVDEAYVRRCEETYRDGGLLPGSLLASTFSTLRANELVWYFVINNYLMGRTPRAFDLLYWNTDSANLPGTLYAWYLRNMYLENNLRVPGRLQLCGRPVDLGTLHYPAYVLAAREDHIVPWRSAYASTQLLGGASQFVLAASGHIAGVVNPACAGRRSHWVGSDLPADADTWLGRAKSVAGSWWPHWVDWIVPHSGAMRSAPPSLGSAAHPPLEAAPGSYVKERPS